MAAELEKLAQYYADKGNLARAKIYAGLAQEERANSGPETFFPDIKQGTSRVASCETILANLGVRPFDLEIGGKKPTNLEKLLKDVSYTSDYAKSLIGNRNEFYTLPGQTNIRLAMLPNHALGFNGWATTAQVLGTKDDVDDNGKPAPFTRGRGQELGFELCPPEVGIYQRKADTKQELGDTYWIAMKPIADRHGYPHVFGLGRGEDGLWLGGIWAYPNYRWSPEYRLVWALPQVASKT